MAAYTVLLQACYLALAVKLSNSPTWYLHVHLQGLVKLADFGVAAKLGELEEQHNDELHQNVVGTPYWMAPEVSSRQLGATRASSNGIGSMQSRRCLLHLVGSSNMELLSQRCSQHHTLRINPGATGAYCCHRGVYLTVPVTSCR